MCANEPHSFKNVRKCAATPLGIDILALSLLLSNLEQSKKKTKKVGNREKIC